jgi:putative hydrolase of the HAD superfamily
MKTVIFDWKQTLYNPDEKKLIDGAIDILSFLKDKGISLAVIGKGASDMYNEVECLGIKEYFDHIAFREGTKDAKLFEEVVAKAGADQTVFIGDRVRSELEVGNSLGCKTIWVRQGKFADEEPENKNQEPTYIVSSLNEAQDLIKNQLIA